MGSDDGGIRTLRPEAEPLIQGFDSKAPGVRVSSIKEWTSLRNFVEVLGVAEPEIKADVLRHLCYFLSSSAATIKYPSPTSAENVSLSAVVGDREVYVDYEELVALHDLLFLELARRIPLFSAENEKFAESLSAFPSTLRELKVAALTLRCCIRLRRLIELFDTGLRSAMGVGLDNLLQKLCSPTEPCLLPTKVYSSEVITSNIKPFRAPLLCALLEVFVDELLCRPKTQLLLVQAAVTVWDDLPADIHEKILHKLEFIYLFRMKVLSKSFKNYVESEAFRQSRAEVAEGSFTAINYYIKHRAWQCSGYDLHTKSWRALPPLSYLPPPDAELFKEYSVCGHGGLMCAEVSKSPKKGEFVVFNPLTGEKKALPPLLFPRNPVLVHMVVNSAQKSYKVIVAGSSTASDEHLSRKMEIFDSSTSEWKSTLDLPGPTFGLNEHQTGVCLNGILFFTSFLAGACRRGVVAFDVAKGQWVTNMTCPIPFSSSSNTLQLVESDGKLYLFSEQERGAIVEHCIDEMEFPNPEAGVLSCQWRNVVRVSKSGGRGLLLYPEYTCVGFGEGKLCIFNTLNRDGVVYDMRDGRQCEVLEKPPADQKGDNFFSLNPALFTIQPSFDRDPS